MSINHNSLFFSSRFSATPTQLQKLVAQSCSNSCTPLWTGLHHSIQARALENRAFVSRTTDTVTFQARKIWPNILKPTTEEEKALVAIVLQASTTVPPNQMHDGMMTYVLSQANEYTRKNNLVDLNEKNVEQLIRKNVFKTTDDFVAYGGQAPNHASSKFPSQLQLLPLLTPNQLPQHQLPKQITAAGDYDQQIQPQQHPHSAGLSSAGPSKFVPIAPASPERSRWQKDRQNSKNAHKESMAARNKYMDARNAITLAPNTPGELTDDEMPKTNNAKYSKYSTRLQRKRDKYFPLKKAPV
jgi:hypothetical protein